MNPEIGARDADAALVSILSQPGWRQRDVIRVLAVLGLQAVAEGRPVGPSIERCSRSLWAELGLGPEADPETVRDALDDHFAQDPLAPDLLTALTEHGRSARLAQLPLPPAQAGRNVLRAVVTAHGTHAVEL